MEQELLQEIASYWGTRAEGYSEVNEKELAGSQREAWLHVLEEQFPEKKKEEMKILDIGTGPGFFPMILSEAGYTVTAVDYTEEMLEKAKENLGKYTKYGLVFPYRFFSLILIHMPALEIMEDFTKKEQLRLVVLSSASEAFSVLGKAYGIHTNGQNIGILLNTSIAEAELTAELKRLCSAISQRMQQTLSIDPFFSIVLCEQASPSYQKSWQLARRNLLFTSPETEDFMIIGHQEDLTSSLDPNLSIQLSRALIDRDQAVARKIADSFFSRYLETANTQEARKLTTIRMQPNLLFLHPGTFKCQNKNLHGSPHLYLPGNFLYPAALQGGAFRPSDRGRRWLKPGLPF